MRAILENTQELEISSMDDISRLIPSSMSGKALNYGQGEGQFKIENSIWGIYYHSSNKYSLQFEEGLLSWEELQNIVSILIKHINVEFQTNINYLFEGMLEHYDIHSKYEKYSENAGLKK